MDARSVFEVVKKGRLLFYSSGGKEGEPLVFCASSALLHSKKARYRQHVEALDRVEVRESPDVTVELKIGMHYVA